MEKNHIKFHLATVLIALLSFLMNSKIYCQDYIPQNIKSDILFGKVEFDNIILNENKSNEEYEESFCNDYIKKKYGSRSNEQFYYFSNYDPDFASYTNLEIGAQFYVASSSEIIKSGIIGYIICRPLEVLKFYTVLSGADKITKDENTHQTILLCSKNKPNTKLNFDKVTDENLLNRLLSEVLEKTKNITTEMMEENHTRTDITAIEGNFTNSGETEYVISYHKITSMEFCISYLVIVNNNGKILKEVSPLLNIGRHFICQGTSDYNSDGKSEIIVDDGYYEGGCLLLLEYNENQFEAIAKGFDDGL